MARPINEAILDPTKVLWQIPSPLPRTAKRTERKYHVPSQAYEHFYTHPLPWSFVISTVNEMECVGRACFYAKVERGKEP